VPIIWALVEGRSLTCGPNVTGLRAGNAFAAIPEHGCMQIAVLNCDASDHR
jgi:hypothetical protein